LEILWRCDEEEWKGDWVNGMGFGILKLGEVLLDI
jgi:hypothetical protein